MRKLLSIIYSVIICTHLSAQGTAVYRDSVSDRIVQYAEQVMEQWKIPGMSLAVAHHGEVTVLEGLGVKQLGKSVARHGADAAVTPQTVFHIGSMTKAFTATVIASLVDQGLLSWEDRVKDILPDFGWADGSIESQLQVRDLLTHRTGLVAQAGTYIPNLGYSREEVYRMIQYIEPMYGFGEKFAYNNVTFIIASQVIEAVSGISWEDNVRQRILEPLGMYDSTPEVQGYLDAGKRASTAHYFGHRKGSANGGQGSIVISPLHGDNRALHWVNEIGPAGSIISTAEDMIRWTEFHLRDNFLLSPYQMHFLHSPATKVSTDTTNTRHYGYCWYIEDHEGCEVIYHTGTTWGFTGICGFVPSLDVSFALLCNSEVSEYARKAVMRRIIDLYNGADTLRDWSSEGLEAWYKYRNGPRKRTVPCTIEYSRTKPSDLSRFVGVYKKAASTADGKPLDPDIFGDAEITMKNGCLYITIGSQGWTHRLEHSSGNIFLFTSDGHTFPLYFHGYIPGSTRPISFELDLNYNENFGAWEKTGK